MLASPVFRTNTKLTDGERLVPHWHYCLLVWEKPAKQPQRGACGGSFGKTILIFQKNNRSEHQKTLKICLRPQRGAFSGVLHAHTVASKKRTMFYTRGTRVQKRQIFPVNIAKISKPALKPSCCLKFGKAAKFKIHFGLSSAGTLPIVFFTPSAAWHLAQSRNKQKH